MSEPRNEGSEQDPKRKLDGMNFRKHRSSRACEVCHLRKVRCDAVLHIPCSNCVIFGCECKFPEKKRRKNARDASPSPRAQNVRAGVRQKSVPAAMVVKNEFHSVNGAQLPVPQHQARAEAGFSDKHVTSRVPGPVMEAISGVTRVAQATPPKRQLPFVGSTSFFTLLAEDSDRRTFNRYVPASAESTRPHYDERLESTGAFKFPVPDLCDAIVESYFQAVHPFELVIDQSQFMREYRKGTVSLFLLQAILMAGSRTCRDERLKHEGSNYSATTAFFERARTLYEARYEKDPLVVVQGILLLSRFMTNILDATPPFMWVRIAIAEAQSHGFHRRAPLGLSNNERKLRRLVWWSLYSRDVLNALSYGRPTSIALADCDIELLTHDDFTFDGEEPQYSVNEAYRDFTIQQVKLAEIMTIVLKEQYSCAADRSNPLVIQHCDMLMNIWMNNLPQTLQYNWSQSHVSHSLPSAVINIFYYHTLCLLHRSHLSKQQNEATDAAYPSVGIAFQSAYSISVIAKRLHKEGQVGDCPPFAMMALFSAKITMMFYIESENANVSKAAREGCETLSVVLEELAKYWIVVRMMLFWTNKYLIDPEARRRIVEKHVKMYAQAGELATVVSPNAHVAGQQVAQTTSLQQVPQVASPVGSVGVPNEPLQLGVQPVQLSNPSPAAPDLYLFTTALSNQQFQQDFSPSELFPMLPGERRQQAASVAESQTPLEQVQQLHQAMARSDSSSADLNMNFLNLQNDVPAIDFGEIMDKSWM